MNDPRDGIVVMVRPLESGGDAPAEAWRFAARVITTAVHYELQATAEILAGRRTGTPELRVTAVPDVGALLLSERELRSRMKALIEYVDVGCEWTVTRTSVRNIDEILEIRDAGRAMWFVEPGLDIAASNPAIVKPPRSTGERTHDTRSDGSDLTR